MKKTPALVGFSAFQLLSVVWLFPIWWYGAATKRLWNQLRGIFMGDRRFMQVKVLLQHQFSPLFGGDGSWEMHIISIFIRIPLTACVLLGTVALGAGLIAAFLLWLLVPVAAFGSMLYQMHLIPVSPFQLLA